MQVKLNILKEDNINLTIHMITELMNFHRKLNNSPKNIGKLMMNQKKL